jgi:DNA-binding transcriptional regulator WhiA
MPYTNEECIEALTKASEKVGRSVGYEEYQKMDIYPTIPVMCRIFGSFNEAKEAAELETRFGGNNVREIDEEYFSDIDCTEKAYWIGFIYGDGWVSLDRDGLQDNFGIEIIDRDHLVKFQEAINSNHTLSEKEKRKNNTYKIQIDNDAFVSYLVDRGVTADKTFEDTLPEFTSSNLQAAFVRGLFDADGSISDGGWCLISSSKERLSALQSWIPFDTTINSRSECYELRLIPNKSRLAPWLYPNGKNTEPALDRKRFEKP